MTPSETPRPVVLGSLTAMERPGTTPQSPTVLLIHGFGGDERAMWVFGSALPTSVRVISLRGLYPTEGSGFHWHRGSRWPPPPADAFAPAVEAIGRSLSATRLASDPVWIGFSQGAALTFSGIAAGLPARGVACLSGYLPTQLEDLPPGLDVFWAHGRKDRRVPVGQARRDSEWLREHGAEVDLCLSESGHRVGAECLRSLRRWLARRVEAG